MTSTVNFLVGGEAGQGVQTIGYLLAKSLAVKNYHVFADQDYESRVRGGHNFFRVRAADTEIFAVDDAVDVLLAFNRESIDLHRHRVREGGLIVYDAGAVTDFNDAKGYGIHGGRLAQAATGDERTANTVVLAAALAVCGYELEALQEVLRQYFKEAAGEKNIQSAAIAYNYVRENPPEPVAVHLTGLPENGRRMLLTGNEAMALGAIAAGCRFMAAYPMTPITPVIEYFAGKAGDFGMVMVPAEDEIAAINMTVGAAYAGVRAMTATSGGGFCLMVEGMGLAGMTETPLVIIEGQRPGPAIGLPTRQEQGDLDFVLHASHGEFPRIVLAPATIAGSFRAVVKAFDLAEKYQLPVVVMTDHHLATSYSTVAAFDLTGINIDRGAIDRAGSKEYRRHRLTDDGISPRAFPGKSAALVVTDSDEHDEAGHLTEDAAIRTAMMNKRLGKLVQAGKDIALPEFYGDPAPETILVSWGSVCGAVREAVAQLTAEGIKAAGLNFSEIFPFPAGAVTEILNRSRNVIVVEGNATGQMAKLLQRETCIRVSKLLLRYDGRPPVPAEIAGAVREEVKR